MSQPHQITVVTGGIDQNDSVSACQRIDGIGQRLASGRLIFGSGIMNFAETKMVGDLEIASDLPGPGASVLDKVGEALLPRIEINGSDALSRLDRRYRKYALRP
jgi:hypothetical protein